MAKWPYNTETWQRLRAVKLQLNPLCEPCGRAGRIVPALLVDHVVAISDGGHPFPSLDGLASMCQHCHNEKHAGGIKGCDVNGLPVDPGSAFFA